MRRRRLPTVIVGCLLGACAACGSAAPSSGGTPTTTTGVVNPAADHATANAINLVASDLPGWTQSPANPDTNDPGDVQAALCAGAPNPNTSDDVNVNSPNFSKGATEVSSNVDFVRTRAEGLQDLRAFTGAKIAGCLEHAGASELASEVPKGTTVDDVTVTHITVPSLPPSSFALRLTLALTVPQEGQVTISGDEIGFLSGRAEVSLTVLQEQGTPDTSFEKYLMSVLSTRTQQQGSRTA